MLLHWWKFKRQLSAYRNHSLPQKEFRELWNHLYHCGECREELNSYEELGDMLRRVPAPAVPADLEFRVRLRLSQERYYQQRPGWLPTLFETWKHLALPGATGLLSAMVLLVIFASHVTPAVRAGSGDVLLDLRTSARIRDSHVLDLDSESGDMVVQLLIDQQGRVADYSILAGNYTPADVRKLRSNLLFAVFDPARVFGTPVSETLVLVNIRG
jgi:anti-sigma factor RsiW